MSDDKKVLVAETDERLTISLKGVLSDMGYNAVISDDGAVALNKALSDMPDLIVLAVSLPTIDGIKLSQILRSNPRTESIPLIFLSDSEIIIPHFQRHRDSLFIRPVNVDEVAARIYSTYDKLAKTRDVSREGKIIEGGLSEISLPDLLQMFSMNKKEGRLCLTRLKERGDIWLQDGNIIDAAVGEVSGEKALFRLLTWKTGTFKLLPAKVTVSKKINRATDSLIMEGLRQYDEWESLKDKFPPMDAGLKVLIDPSTLPKGLRPITHEIFLLLEFYPRVSDIIDRNTFPDYEVMRTIMTLLTKGIIGITREKGHEERPILPREDLLKLKERFASRTSYKLDKELGKVLIFYHDSDKVRYAINAMNILPEFHIHKDFLKGMGPNQYMGVAGNLQISENIQMTFIALPVSEVFSPLWRPLSNSMLGGLMVVNGETGKWDEINKIAGYFQGGLGKPMAFAVPEGDASGDRVREVKEHLNRKNEAMLFPIVKNDAEGVRDMLSSLFRSVIGAL